MTRWRPVAFVASMLLLAVAGIWYTNYVQRQTEQKLCRVTAVMMDGVPPPTTARAKKIAKAMADFRADLDC